MAICGKMGISMSFCVAWLYGAEMYPTNIRYYKHTHMHAGMHTHNSMHTHTNLT